MKIKLGLMLLITVLNFGSTVYAEDSDEQLLSKGMWHDPVTGLIWMRCSLGQKWDNNTCVGDAEKIGWVNAMFEADKISYAGHNDWYLPSMDDLRSLRKCSSGYRVVIGASGIGEYDKERHCVYSRENGEHTTSKTPFIVPAIDQLTFPNTPITERTSGYWRESLFWSSEYLFEDNSPKAKMVEFGVDIGGQRDLSDSTERVFVGSAKTILSNGRLGFVRLVRSGNSNDEFSKNLLIAKDLRAKRDEYMAGVNNVNEQKRKKEEEYVKKTAAFRKSVKEGDDTTFGVVIQVKGSLVKIQTEESKCTQRDYKGNCDNYINDSVEKWFKRSEIYPLE